MGRPSHARSLSVWSNDERVGTWTIPARGDSQFLYDRAWRESAVGRPLSLSLPYTGDIPLRGDVVRDYFDNLLPDSEPIRKRMASHYKLGSIDAFDLLQEIGRDCVGAVQLLKEDESPTDVNRIEGTPMLEEDVERYLIGLTQPLPPGAGWTPTICPSRWRAHRKRLPCYGITAAGCGRTARRQPPTFSSCPWDWSVIARPT